MNFCGELSIMGPQDVMSRHTCCGCGKHPELGEKRAVWNEVHRTTELCEHCIRAAYEMIDGVSGNTRALHIARQLAMVHIGDGDELGDIARGLGWLNRQTPDDACGGISGTGGAMKCEAQEKGLLKDPDNPAWTCGNAATVDIELRGSVTGETIDASVCEACARSLCGIILCGIIMPARHE